MEFRHNKHGRQKHPPVTNRYTDRPELSNTFNPRARRLDSIAHYSGRTVFQATLNCLYPHLR